MSNASTIVSNALNEPYLECVCVCIVHAFVLHIVQIAFSVVNSKQKEKKASRECSAKRKQKNRQVSETTLLLTRYLFAFVLWNTIQWPNVGAQRLKIQFKCEYRCRVQTWQCSAAQSELTILFYFFCFILIEWINMQCKCKHSKWIWASALAVNKIRCVCICGHDIV